MSLWATLQAQASGEEIKQEDIHKATLLIKKMGGAEKLIGFYGRGEILFELNHDQQQSFRWHRCDLVLDDERFKRRALYRLGVLSTLGDTGESIVQDAINTVEKKYGYFDGYTCDEEKTEMHKYVSEKNKEMIDEIRDILDRHGMVLLGWRYLIKYKRAVSAELIQDLYYDSDGLDGKESRVLRAYGPTKEKEIGKYKVTYEVFKRKNNEEIVTNTLTDNYFYAAIGTDVVATWQKLNDEHVRENGNWSSFVGPSGSPFEAVVYSHEHEDQQGEKYKKVWRAYLDSLCEEHGSKIGVFEDNKLGVKYWKAFTVYLNQKDMDILKNDDPDYSSLSKKYKVDIDDYFYECHIHLGIKNPTFSISVIIRLSYFNTKQDEARYDFIEEKCKTQIESLQCKKVEWEKDGCPFQIRVILDADFRDKSDWHRQFEWLYNTLMGLHKIVKPYYEDIRGIK